MGTMKRKKIYSLVLLLMMLCTMITPIQGYAADSSLDQSDFDTSGGDVIITLDSNFELTEPVEIKGKVTIKADGDTMRTLISTGSAITIVTGGALTIDPNVTISGADDANGVVVVGYAGSYTMNPGSCLNNRKTGVATALEVNGGASAVLEGALVETEGNANISANGETEGAAIAVYGMSSLSITGGTVIRANAERGLGVSVAAGSQVNNSAGSSSKIEAIGNDGVGVFVGLGGTYQMSGGNVCGGIAGIRSYSEDADAKAIIHVSGGVVEASTDGDPGHDGGVAIYADKQTKTTITDTAVVTATGDYGTGIRICGLDAMDGLTEEIFGEIGGMATVTSTGEGGRAVYALATGKGCVTIKDDAVIEASGDAATAVDAYGCAFVKIRDNARIKATANAWTAISSQHGSNVVIKTIVSTDAAIQSSNIGAFIGVGGSLEAVIGEIEAVLGLSIFAEDELEAPASVIVSNGFTIDSSKDDIYLCGISAITDVTVHYQDKLFVAPDQIYTQKGTAFADLDLPETLPFRISDNIASWYPVVVNWEIGDYQADIPGHYIIKGNVSDPAGLKVLVGVGVTVANPEFVDVHGVSEWSWAEESIMALQAARIMFGTSDTTFSPGISISRADFAVVLCRAFQLPTDDEPTSFDVFDADNTGADNDDQDDGVFNAHEPEYIRYIQGAKHLFFTSENTDSTTDMTFWPEKTLKRQDLVYSLVKALGLTMTDAQMSAAMSAAASKYSKDWTDPIWNDNSAQDYHKAIAIATALGFVSGDGNGRFNPNQDVNRAQAAVLINRALKYSGGTGGGVFSDVKPGDWYYSAVMNLVNRGIVSGYPDGTFQADLPMESRALPYLVARMTGGDVSNPLGDATHVTNYLPAGFVSSSDLLTREDAIYTIAKLTGLTELSGASLDSVLSVFADQSKITADYEGYVGAAISANYISGIYEGQDYMLYPKGCITRAEIAKLLELALPDTGANKYMEGQVFSDVALGDWYYDGIMTLYNLGIVHGYEDGSFRPDDPLDDPSTPDFNEFAFLIWHLNNPTLPNANYSTSAGAIYFPFGITDPIKEGAAYTLVNLMGYDLTGINADEILSRFTDAKDVDSVCENEMAFLVSLGAVKGDSDGKLKPLEELSRAQFCVLYARLLNGIDESKMYDYQTTIEAVKGI